MIAIPEEDGSPPRKSSIIGMKEDPDIFLSIPYSYYYTVGGSTQPKP